MKMQINHCLVSFNRYDKLLNEIFTVKCFDNNKTNEYVDLMKGKLQKRRIEADYYFRSTNKPRQKTQECVWNNASTHDAIKAHLNEAYDYYNFCNQCLGSEHDLFVT